MAKSGPWKAMAVVIGVSVGQGVKTLAIPQFFGFPRLNLSLTRPKAVIKSLPKQGVNLAHPYIQVLSLSQWGTAPKNG